jgi:hypothetical protein
MIHMVLSLLISKSLLMLVYRIVIHPCDECSSRRALLDG